MAKVFRNLSLTFSALALVAAAAFFAFPPAAVAQEADGSQSLVDKIGSYGLTSILGQPYPLWLAIVALVLFGGAVVALVAFLIARATPTEKPAKAAASAAKTAPAEEQAEVVEVQDITPVEDIPAEVAPLADIAPAEEVAPVPEVVPAEEVAPAEEIAPAEEAAVAPLILPAEESEREERAEFYSSLEENKKYDRSFRAKLIQSSDVVKERYGTIFNMLTAYKGVKSRYSWDCETFKAGGRVVAKVTIIGKTPVLFLALDPAQFENTKYRIEDASKYAKYAVTPARFKVNAERKVGYARDLIALAMQDFEYLGESERLPEIPYQEDEELLSEGLIKTIK